MAGSLAANRLPPGRFADPVRAGEGGEGGVWLARDLKRGGRRVSLKWISIDGLARTRRALRLLEDIASPHLAVPLDLVPARGLAHPKGHAVDTLAIGDPVEGAWLVTGWVEGAPLARGPAPWAEVAPQLLGLARALQTLHELGAHHGDVSPANALLTPTGATVLIDLGALTTEGVGTPGFMAPETMSGGGGLAADTWSLAAVACVRWLGDVPARDVARLRSRADVERRLRVLVDAAEHPVVEGERAAMRLLTAMLTPAPTDRPSMAGVVDALSTWASGDPRDVTSRELVTWTRPAPSDGTWPWVGGELAEIVDAVQRDVRLIGIDGKDEVGARWLAEASRAALVTQGAEAEAVSARSLDVLLARWLDASADRVLVALPDEALDPVTWRGLVRAAPLARATLLVAGVVRAWVARDDDASHEVLEPATALHLRDDSSPRVVDDHSVEWIELAPRTDLELSRLLALAGVRRRTRPWVEALRASSGGIAGRALRVVSAWIDLQAQSPSARDVASVVASRGGVAPLHALDAARVLDVAWGLDTEDLPASLGASRIPHDVVLAAARRHVVARVSVAHLRARARAAYEQRLARDARCSASLALDLGLHPSNEEHAVATEELDGHVALDAVVRVLLAADDDGELDPRDPVSAAESSAFDTWAMRCLPEALRHAPRPTLARAALALARRRLRAGAPSDALTLHAAWSSALATSPALASRGADDDLAHELLSVAWAIEGARARQRLGQPCEAALLVEEANAGLARSTSAEPAHDSEGDEHPPTALRSHAAAVTAVRVAAIEARVAVDLGQAAALHGSGSVNRARARALLATIESDGSHHADARALGERRRAELELDTWSTLLALHAGDLDAACAGAEVLHAGLERAAHDDVPLGRGRIARALHVAGNVAQARGRLRDAAACYALAAASFRESGEDVASVLVLASAAGLAWPTGDVAGTLELGRAALRSALARATTGPASAGGDVWGVLTNVAPALLHSDPAQLAAWIDALAEAPVASGLDEARRAVFRAWRVRVASASTGSPASARGRMPASPSGHSPSCDQVDAEAARAQQRLFELGAVDEAIAHALDDVAHALRRGDSRGAAVHLGRALGWASDTSVREDVLALLAAARVEVLVAQDRAAGNAHAGETSRVASSDAERPSAVLTALVAAGSPEEWSAREQPWVGLRLQLAIHRLLRAANMSPRPRPLDASASTAASAAHAHHVVQPSLDESSLHVSERRLAAALEVLMKKTPPTEQPALVRSLALSDDEVTWLEGLARGVAPDAADARARVDTRSGAHGVASPVNSTPLASPAAPSSLVSVTSPTSPAVGTLGEGRPHDEATWRARGLAAYRRLAREDEIDRVLAHFVDALMELTDAERGLVVLVDEGERIEVARELQGDGAAVQVSRSVVERVMESGEPVLANDAVEDARFGRARSVSHLALRSILAVPLRHRGRVIGAAYVDHRLRRGAFDETSLAGVEVFADLASLAVAHARAVALLRARSDALALREAELAAALDAREVEVAALRHEAGQGAQLQLGSRTLVGGSGVMQRVFRLLRRVATSNVPVVVAGESGTGKELVARALHELGPRSKAPFIAENCAAIPETLLESALFGHARGAFTGAVQAAPGLFEAANGGTLFLDEITETSLAMQSKLLRVLQEGEVRRLGETSSRRVDVRVVVATNRDLERLVAEGKFRQDLYYRLSVVRVDVPSLRERVEDIPQLVGHFLRVAGSSHGEGAALRVSSAVMRRLAHYPWPGNVRELENEVRRWLALVDDVVREEDLSASILAATGGAPERRELPPGEALVELLSDPAFIEPEDQAAGRGEGAERTPSVLDDAALDLRTHVDRVERALVAEALRRTGNNLTRAAKLLGLSRFGLQKKLRRRDDASEPTLGGENVELLTSEDESASRSVDGRRSRAERSRG